MILQSPLCREALRCSDAWCHPVGINMIVMNDHYQPLSTIAMTIKDHDRSTTINIIDD